MRQEITGSFTVNPLAVEDELRRCPFTYPGRNDQVDDFRGWGKVAVIPSLFQLMVQLGRFPSGAEGCAYLMKVCDPAVKDDRGVQRRAEKLYLDFARDMHTKGLLDRASFLAYVEYQKVLDVGFNVDFVAALLRPWTQRNDPRIGVQAKMRQEKYWQGFDPWDARKAERRARRHASEWGGPLYWLTNRSRAPEKQIAKCWLFGMGHIRDLAEEIQADLSNQSSAMCDLDGSPRAQLGRVAIQPSFDW